VPAENPTPHPEADVGDLILDKCLPTWDSDNACIHVGESFEEWIMHASMWEYDLPESELLAGR
jgi:hypothetical protein